MGGLIPGDDGLPAEEVGLWAKDKHDRLRRYLDISRATRKKYLTGSARSASLIDLFCGSGRARIEETGEWIDGGAVAAWKISVAGGAPFSEVYVADLDEERRAASVERLTRLNAPVQELGGGAVQAAAEVSRIVNRHGLHFAFLDPYSLGALDFDIFKSLARIRRVDILVHVSAMDLQRNLDANLGQLMNNFDTFVPGWRDHVDTNGSQVETRRRIIDYWKSLITELGKTPSERMELITGNRNQRLYWLCLVANHDLAQKFWEVATDTGQGRLI